MPESLSKEVGGLPLKPLNGNQPKDPISPRNTSMGVFAEGGKSLWTNVTPLVSKSKLALYEIDCQPKGRLTKREERWLVDAFRLHCHIEPCLGRLVFLDTKHFITCDYNESCDGNFHSWTIDRQEHRPNKFYKRIYLGNDQSKKTWSMLTGCPAWIGVQENDYDEDLKYRAGSTLGSFQARANCRVVEHLDLAKVTGTASETERFAPALNRFASAFQRFYIPKNPTVAMSNPFISENVVVHGNKTFDFATQGQSIGFGLESRAGIGSTIRPASDGLISVQKPCKRVFYAPSKLSTFIAIHKPNFAMDSTKHIEELSDIIRGLRIRVKQANGHVRLATICGITPTCPTDTLFYLADEGA